MFWVDLAALGDAGRRLDSTAQEIGSLRPDEALAGSPQALRGTQTSCAVDQLSLRITTAVASYALATAGFGERTVATAQDYAVVDAGVEESIRRLAP